MRNSRRMERALNASIVLVFLVMFALLALTVVAVIEYFPMLFDEVDKVAYPLKYTEEISAAAEEFSVPEEVICAVIYAESNFDKDARSPVGAIGLMQIMPKTFEWLTGDEHLGEHLNKRMLFDPETNIKYGTYYLSYLYKKFDRNTNTVLAAYNGGEGNVAKWLKDPAYSDDGKNLKDIPFKETKNYVSKVNNEIQAYKDLYYEQNEVKKT